MADRYTRRINLYINGKEVRNDIGSIGKAMRKLQSEQRLMNRGSLEYQAHMKKIKYLGGIMAKHRNDLRATTSIWKRAGDAVNNYMGLAMGVIAAFAGVFAIMKKFKGVIDEFEESITNVYTLLDDKDYDAFKDVLADGATELIKEYGFEIKDVNKALFDAISAGIPAGEAIQFIKESAVLAKGGVTSLTTSVDGLTSILNAYALETTETDKVTSAFFTAQKYGKTTVEELATGIGAVVPIAAQAGVSYQELLSGIAAMTTQGLKSNLAITAMKNTIQSVLKPGKAAEKVLRELGVPVGTTEVRAKGLGYAMEKLNAAMLDNPDAISKAIPNIRGLIGVSALAGNGLEKYHDILQKVNSDYGDHSSLSKAYQKQMATNVQKMNSAIGARKAEILLLKNDLTPIFIQAIKLTTLSTRMFLKFLQVLTNNKEIIFGLITATAAYYTRLLLVVALEKSRAIAVAANVLATKLQIAITGRATMAQKRLIVSTRALNIATKGTPWGLIIGLLAGAAAAYMAFQKKVKTAVVEQKLFNDVLKQSESLLLQNKSLDERASIMKNLSKEQLQNLKADLAYQIREEENFHATLLQKLKKRLSEDVQLADMNESLKNEALSLRGKQRIQIAIGNRKVQLARELEEEGEANKQRIKLLESHLSNASGLLKKMGEYEEDPVSSEDELKKMSDSVIANLQIELNKKKALITHDRANQLITEKQFKDQMEALNFVHLMAKNDALEKFGQENSATLLEIANDELKITEDTLKEEAKLKEDFRKLMREVLPEEEDELQDPAMSYEILQYQKTLEYKKVLLDAYYAKGKISEQEYQDKIALLNQEGINKQFDMKMESAEKAAAFSRMAADAVYSLMDMELAKAGDNEEKKLDIRKKYADIGFAVTAAEIISNTALAVVRALAELGPIGGPIAAVMMGVTGLAQLGIANAQRTNVQGMADGGFAGHTGPGGKYQKKQLVQLHAEEYVIPKELMQMPAVAEIVAGFEAMRTNRAGVSQLALSAMSTGGSVSTKPSEDATLSSPFQSNPDLLPILKQNTAAIENLLNMKIYTSMEDIRTGEKRYAGIENTRGL